MRKSTRLLGVASSALLLLAGATGTASAGADRPFKGTVAGEAAFEPVPTTVCSDVVIPELGMGLQTVSRATGQFTHLGASSMYSAHCTPSGSAISGGAMTVKAANGDEVHMVYDGTADPMPALGESLVVKGNFEIKGGTGRFAGASGNGKYVVTIVYEGLQDMSWPGTWTYKGTIRY